MNLNITKEDQQRAEELYPREGKIRSQYEDERQELRIDGYERACHDKNEERDEFTEWVGDYAMKCPSLPVWSLKESCPKFESHERAYTTTELYQIFKQQ